jgi:hypothetical protein
MRNQVQNLFSVKEQASFSLVHILPGTITAVHTQIEALFRWKVTGSQVSVRAIK